MTVRIPATLPIVSKLQEASYMTNLHLVLMSSAKDNRTVTPRRRPNSELHPREHLTERQVERAISGASPHAAARMRVRVGEQRHRHSDAAGGTLATAQSNRRYVTQRPVGSRTCGGEAEAIRLRRR